MLDVPLDCPGPEEGGRLPGAAGLWGRGAFAPPVGTAKATQPLDWAAVQGYPSLHLYATAQGRDSRLSRLLFFLSMEMTGEEKGDAHVGQGLVPPLRGLSQKPPSILAKRLEYTHSTDRKVNREGTHFRGPAAPRTLKLR